MISIKDIRKSYRMGDTVLEVLKGVSLDIHDGDFVAIMGPSGSGKSTLMNILGLLDNPTQGSYQLHRVETSHMTEDELAIVRREQIGFIFQQFNLLARVSAYNNVTLPLLYSKKTESYEYARELLEQVGLGERMNHQPNELSGGQQQRVAIARSLVNRPRIIFADEPTGNLDSQSEKEILRILKDLNSQGITIVMVTHEEEIGLQANRLIRMRDGLIQSDERRQSFSEQAVPDFKFEKPKPSVSDFLAYFKQGLGTLLANKGRTFLSMLGVLIGVAAVVTMLAVGTGAQRSIEKQLSSLGSNMLNVRPGVPKVSGVAQEGSIANRLSLGDADILRARIPQIKTVSASISGRGQVTFARKNWNTYVNGVSATWIQMQSKPLSSGRFFTEQDVHGRARVALIGQTVRKELFGEADPVGEMIKINKVIFQVIGVLPIKGASFRDEDDTIVIPVTTGMYRLFGKPYVDSLEVQVTKTEDMGAVDTLLRDVLSNVHKIPLSQREDAYNVWNMAELQDTIKQSSRTMSVLLSSIAAISLVVGGIGIMNIMLVSVTERTKEIGLRKAIGARRSDILSQFLSESVVISVVGGLMGIIFGSLCSFAISSLLGWGTVISLGSVLVSFIFSALIGIVFGVYPAQKASRLSPIEALRYE